MISKASVSFVRISPRKVRYVIDLIRHKSVPQAQAILIGSPRRGGEILQKLLAQAVNAAERNSQLTPDQLVVSKVLADGGPTMKRFRAATMGRANHIKKRTSHIQIELDLAKKHASFPAKSMKAAAAEPKSATKPASPAGRHGGSSTAAKKITSKKLVGAK